MRKAGFKYCSECKNGELGADDDRDFDVEADFLVTGRMDGYTGRRHPFRKYLCDTHLMILEDDGAEVKTCKELNQDY